MTDTPARPVSNMPWPAALFLGAVLTGGGFFAAQGVISAVEKASNDTLWSDELVSQVQEGMERNSASIHTYSEIAGLKVDQSLFTKRFVDQTNNTDTHAAREMFEALKDYGGTVTRIVAVGTDRAPASLIQQMTESDEKLNKFSGVRVYLHALGAKPDTPVDVAEADAVALYVAHDSLARRGVLFSEGRDLEVSRELIAGAAREFPVMPLSYGMFQEKLLDHAAKETDALRTEWKIANQILHDGATIGSVQKLAAAQKLAASAHEQLIRKAFNTENELNLYPHGMEQLADYLKPKPASNYSVE